MKENKKTLKDKAEDIRKDLDNLIGSDAPNIDEIAETDPVLLPIKEKTARATFADLKSSSVTAAKKTISSLMKFYLDEDIIERDEYIQSKKLIDEMTMASLLFQLNAGERALTTLLEAIDDGDIQPRMFEVLATLQKSMLDIIKSQTMYLMATEESTKRIARDIEIYRRKDSIKEIEESGGDSGDANTMRGSKDLMRLIQDGIDSGDVEDAESSAIE